MKKGVLFLLILWQFPQTLCAWVYLLYLKIAGIECTMLDDTVRVVAKMPKGAGGVSFGEYIFVKKSCYSQNTIKHEKGHSKQSRMLGWLYLLIVALPSMILNRMSARDPEFAKNYFNRFPENWADRLGGVVRESEEDKKVCM